MNAAPVPPPDEPGAFLSWLSPHWGWLLTLGTLVAGGIWRAATLASKVEALEKKLDLAIKAVDDKIDASREDHAQLRADLREYIRLMALKADT